MTDYFNWAREALSSWTATAYDYGQSWFYWGFDWLQGVSSCGVFT